MLRVVAHDQGATLRLTNVLQQLREPRRFDIEWFAALHARELDGAQTTATILIVTHDAGFAA
jgi:hypothetical protein